MQGTESAAKGGCEGDGRSEVDKVHKKLLGILSDLGQETDAAKVASSAPPLELNPISRFKGGELENIHKLRTYTEKRWLHWFRDEIVRGVFEAGLRELDVVKGIVEKVVEDAMSYMVERTEDVWCKEEFEDVDQLCPPEYEDDARLTKAQKFEDVDQLCLSRYKNCAGLTEAQGVVTGAGQDEERMEGNLKQDKIRVCDVSFNVLRIG